MGLHHVRLGRLGPSRRWFEQSPKEARGGIRPGLTTTNCTTRSRRRLRRQAWQAAWPTGVSAPLQRRAAAREPAPAIHPGQAAGPRAAPAIPAPLHRMAGPLAAWAARPRGARMALHVLVRELLDVLGARHRRALLGTQSCGRTDARTWATHIRVVIQLLSVNDRLCLSKVTRRKVTQEGACDELRAASTMRTPSRTDANRLAVLQLPAQVAWADVDVSEESALWTSAPGASPVAEQVQLAGLPVVPSLGEAGTRPPRRYAAAARPSLDHECRLGLHVRLGGGDGQGGTPPDGSPQGGDGLSDWRHAEVSRLSASAGPTPRAVPYERWVKRFPVSSEASRDAYLRFRAVDPVWVVARSLCCRHYLRPKPSRRGIQPMWGSHRRGPLFPCLVMPAGIPTPPLLDLCPGMSGTASMKGTTGA